MSGPWDFACMVAWLVMTVTVGPVLWLRDWIASRLPARDPVRGSPRSLGYRWCKEGSVGLWRYHRLPLPWPWIDVGLTAGRLRPGCWGLRVGLVFASVELSVERTRLSAPAYGLFLGFEPHA